jgi:branched-chain amino acid transport system permease protein
MSAMPPWWKLAALAALALAVLALAMLGDQTTLRFATRIAIFALAALAVDLVLGYAGLVSFGHAAFFGLGAYAAGILSLLGYGEAVVIWPIAIATAALAALVIGMLSLRTSGVYFIMITLAFAQMFYYAANALPGLGGADGFRLPARNTLAGLNLSDYRLFFMICCLLLLLVTLAVKRAIAAAFGSALRATRDDDVRAAASGIEAYGLRLFAFTVSGAIAGLAGVLSANLTLYIAPSSTFNWTLSAEFLVIVILGSAGTLLGPLIGAAVLLIIIEVISQYTDFWALFLGLLIIVRVLMFQRGFHEVAWRVFWARP